MALAQRLALQYVRTKFQLLSSLSKTKAAEKAFELFCTPQYRNKRKLPPIFEKAEKISFSFEQYTVRGYRWNTGAGSRALILHGFESSVINFDRYVKPLIKKGYEVLAFDAPAHGRSTGKTINVLIYRNLIAYINNHYGPINAFMAHSFGGLALCLYLADHKHSSDTKIVLIAPATETKTAADNFFRFLKLNEGVRQEFDKFIHRLSGHPIDWFSVKRSLTHIDGRVLFIQDKEDTMTPFSDVEPIMELNLPNVTFYITDGLGHRRIYRDNNTSKRIIDFL
jgi:pimeloyl-ACP methyl ester carboxylesterase